MAQVKALRQLDLHILFRTDKVKLRRPFAGAGSRDAYLFLCCCCCHCDNWSVIIQV